MIAFIIAIVIYFYTWWSFTPQDRGVFASNHKSYYLA